MSRYVPRDSFPYPGQCLVTNDCPKSGIPYLGLTVQAMVIALAGIAGYGVYVNTYMHLAGISWEPQVDAQGNAIIIDYYFGGMIEFVAISLYAFVVGLFAIRYLRHLALLLTAWMLILGAAMGACAVNPDRLVGRVALAGTCGGIAAACLVVPSLYMHLNSFARGQERLSFSLRTLLLVVLAIGVLLGGLALRRQSAEQRFLRFLDATRSDLENN